MTGNHRILLASLGAVLLLSSLGFFYLSALRLAERDYVAGILEIFVGLAIIRGGIELERMTTRERDTE